MPKRFYKEKAEKIESEPKSRKEYIRDEMGG